MLTIQVNHLVVVIVDSHLTVKKVLNYHEKITHKEENIYKCDECQKSLKRKHHLKTHKLTHEEVLGVSCRFCRKSFKTFRTDSFDRHLEKCQGK